MKIKRRILAALLALVLCMSFTVTAFAASAPAGSYGIISGSCYQSAGYLPTSTSVTTNSGDATLRVTIKTTTSANAQVATQSMSSAEGESSFNYRYPIVYHPDALPAKATCTHYVVSLTEIYHTTSYATLDTSYFN